MLENKYYALVLDKDGNRWGPFETLAEVVAFTSELPGGSFHSGQVRVIWECPSLGVFSAQTRPRFGGAFLLSASGGREGWALTGRHSVRPHTTRWDRARRPSPAR
jgi:hypothetical protein